MSAEADRDLLPFLPAWMVEDEEGLRILRGTVLGPLAEVRGILEARRALLPTLLSPRLVPDRLVANLGALVGIGDDLPAARILDVDDRRRHVGSAIRIWTGKGSRSSPARTARAAGGRTSLFLEWADTRIVDGVRFGGIGLWHGPRVADGSAYDDGPRASDLWVMDPAGTLDLDVLAAWVEAAARPAGRRVAVRRALFVDDHRNRAAWWTTASATLDYDDELGAVVTSGDADVLLDVAGSETWPASYRAHLWLATTGTAYLLVLVSDDGAEGYAVAVSTDGTLTLYRRDAGVEVLVAAAADPVPTASGFAYRYAIDVAQVVTSGGLATVVEVFREGSRVLYAEDTDADRKTAGRIGLRAVAGTATLVHADVRPHNPAARLLAPPA